MGGEKSQEERRAAAEAYEYDKDSRWADYWSNVLLPPQMSTRPDVQKHFQLKYYQRYIDSELQVEPLSSLKDSSAPPRTSSTTQQRSVNTGGPARSTGGSIPPRPAARPSPQVDGTLKLDQKSFQLLNNSWVVVMAVFAIFPFLPRGIADRGYRFSLAGSAIACAHCLYQENRRPRTWNLQGLQEWMQTVVPSKNFLSFMFSLIFFSSINPVKFAVIPVFLRSLEQVAVILRRNFNTGHIYKRYLQTPCELLVNNQTMLYTTSANAEIGIGFTLIFMFVTPQRNFVQALIYWQLLKLFYRAPGTSTYHQQLWSKIGARVNPLVNQFAPFLQRPLDYVRNWFLN